MIVGDVKTGLAPGEKGGNRFQRLCRFLNRVTDPVQFARDWWCHVQMSEEKGRRAFFDGTGNFFNETVFEDAPLTADIYHAGMSKGKREGFATAAEMLGGEIRELGKQLVELKKKYNEFSGRQKEAYEKVIKAYDEELLRMKSRCDESEAQNRYFKELFIEREALQRIKA